MSRTWCLLAATVALAACPAKARVPLHPDEPTAPEDTALRVRIARAEATRGGGVTELVDLALHGDHAQRALALRGLGRVGGERALAALEQTLTDADPALAALAASAIAIAAQLDEPEATQRLTVALVAVLGRVPDAHKPLVLEAIGRAGHASAQTMLVRYLASPVPAIAEAAALAYARFGRRKLELDAGARGALLPLLAADPVRRYAATYAFSREHQPPSDPDDRAGIAKSLIARVSDDVAEVRVQAILAIVKRGLVGPAHRVLETALRDTDWRVATEAVRALAGDKGDDAGRDAVAAALARRLAELAAGNRAEAHVVIEGVKALASHGKRPLVAAALTAVRTSAASKAPGDLAYGWIHCLAGVALERAAAAPNLAVVDSCQLPDHLRLPLGAELVSAGTGSLDQRRTTVARLLGHKDARVRAAALPALAALWPAGGEPDHRAAIATLVAAIGAPDPIFAGAAIDAAEAFYDAIGKGDRAALDAAVIARATTERAPELAAALLELIGKRSIAAGAETCRAGLAGHPVRVAAARTCLRALGEAAPAAGLSTLPLPPLDVGAVIGARLAWHLVTTRGDITIELAPEVAPWAIAAIVALTARHTYDGLEVHRVVPGFVVQGGDPTMSGWGGPGFDLPSEPSTLADGGGFVAGGVGMADSGRDSGGSQWFVMHGRAAHLDGRYTWIGRVVAGQKSADALVIGDKVLTATITTTGLGAVPKAVPARP